MDDEMSFEEPWDGSLSRSPFLNSLSRYVRASAKNPDPTRLGKNGVCVPDVGRAEGGCRASREAWRRRLVVPRALVCDDLAEQTRATREFGI